MIISNNQSVVSLYLNLKTFVYLFRLGNIVQNGNFCISCQCLHRHHLRIYSRLDISIRSFCQLDGRYAFACCFFHMIYVIIARYKLQLPAILKDFHYLAFKYAQPYLSHKQFSIGSSLETGKEVKTSYPYYVLAVPIHNSYTADIGGV